MRDTTLVEQEIAAASGFMAPLHAHSTPEVVRMLEGSMTVFAGADTVRLERGQSFVVPEGVAHTFRAESSRARAVFATSAPSASRYEDFLRAVGPPSTRGWSQPEDGAAVASIAGAADVTLIGPPGMLPGTAGEPL
jgi:mannose-6-phosphate isomerase-like protein (cupin superfamily)